MRMKRFRKKTFIRYAQSRNIGKPIDFKILETRRVHLANLRFYFKSKTLLLETRVLANLRFYLISY